MQSLGEYEMDASCTVHIGAQDILAAPPRLGRRREKTYEDGPGDCAFSTVLSKACILPICPVLSSVSAFHVSYTFNLMADLRGILVPTFQMR